MRERHIGLIRVLTTNDPNILNLHGDILEKQFPFKIENDCIHGQPKGVYDEKTHQEAEPKIVELAKEMEQRGLEGIIVSCAADPGVQVCREQLTIPVVGAGSALAAISIAMSDRIGVLTLRNEAPKAVTELLGSKLISEQGMGVSNTLELMKASGMEKVIASVNRLVSKNVEVAALACTGTATIGAKPKIEAQISNIRVVDPVLAAGSVMMAYLSGEIGDYPTYE